MSDVLKDLQDQKAAFEAHLATLSEGTAEYNAANDEINILSNKIAEIEHAMKQEAVIEEKVNADDVPFMVAGADFSKFPAELVAELTSFGELLVKAERRRIYTLHDAEVKEIKGSYEDRITVLTAKVEDVEGERDEAIQARVASERLNDTIADQKRQIDDLTSKLANAAAQIDELKAEQQATAVEEVNTLETEPEEAEAINDALKKLFVSFTNYGTINKVVKEDGSTELVKSDELQSQWAPVGGSESTDSFRDEAPTAVAQDNQLPDTQAAIELPPSPPEVPNDNDTTPGNTTVPTLVESPKGVMERITALEQRMSILEGNQKENAA